MSSGVSVATGILVITRRTTMLPGNAVIDPIEGTTREAYKHPLTIRRGHLLFAVSVSPSSVALAQNRHGSQKWGEAKMARRQTDISFWDEILLCLYRYWNE
ncbi:MAG TPA: hypothetical protein VGI22_03925 [Xanthobacteraceae bacterium]